MQNVKINVNQFRKTRKYLKLNVSTICIFFMLDVTYLLGLLISEFFNALFFIKEYQKALEALSKISYRIILLRIVC